MRRTLATLLPLAFVACSYPEFSFTPTDTGVLVDSAVDSTSPVDSGIDTFVELDSNEPDTAADVVDAADAADARDTADTRPPRGCELTHDFCQNFDGVTSPSENWTGNFSAAGGALALDNTTAVSSPSSLRATIPSATVTASAMVHKSITITSSGTVIRVDADVMLPSLTYGGTNTLMLLKVQRGGSGDGIGLAFDPDIGAEIVAQTDSSWRTWPLTGVVAGKWFHLRIDAVLHPTTGSVKAWVDDMTTPQVNATAVASANVDDLSRQLILGLFAYMSAAPFRVHFDDVSYDVP